MKAGNFCLRRERDVEVFGGLALATRDLLGILVPPPLPVLEYRPAEQQGLKPYL